jgi:endothelin-converting enzyme
LQTIDLGSSEVQFTKQYYLKPDVLANYSRAITEMYHVLQSGKSIDVDPIPANKKAALDAKAKRIVDFEKLIAKNLPDPEVQQDVQYFYKPRTIAQIDKLVPEFSTFDVLKAHVPSNYTITPNTTVILTDSNFFGNLSDIIKSTPRETLHDYFEWRLFSTWISRLYKDYTIPFRRFRNVLAGKEPDVRPERYRQCVQETDDLMGHLLGGVYIQRKFTPNDKQIGDQVIHDIRKIYQENMKNLDWMGDEAKKIAATKGKHWLQSVIYMLIRSIVANIVQKIGYSTKSPNDADPKSLSEYYDKLHISDNYWDNGVAGMKFTLDKSWNELLLPTDRNKWELSPPTVNAYYSPNLNEIVFPAGIMQPPIFSGDLPDYVSYGAFGAIAGHEITHGFDDHGAKYDANGRLRDWWDNSTLSNFEKKTQCFEKQYEKYSIIGPDGDKIFVNGKLTLGENIADAGGINAAFRAWKAREAAAGKPDAKIKGLEEFTNDQMFFVSYGNAWCEKTRPAALQAQVFSDPHSPADLRVVGTTANSADFKKAFNCPVKKATCDLWF